MGKRQQRGEESRLALLDAGIELLEEQDLDTILSARAVAKRANRSTGSFFHYWETTDDYITDLLDHVLRPGSVPSVDEMASLLDQLTAEHTAPVDLLRAICAQDFVNTISDPLLRVEMLLWAHHSDPRVRSALGRFYDWTDDLGIGRFDLISQRWGRTLRRPLDFRLLSIALTALLEGLAIRHLIQPDRVPIDLLGMIVIALLPVILGAARQDETLDDLARQLNTYVQDHVQADQHE
jgi:AcrR family transcriptional regulator